MKEKKNDQKIANILQKKKSASLKKIIENLADRRIICSGGRVYSEFCQKFAAYKEINRNVKAGKLLGADSTLRTDNNSGVKIIPSEEEVLKLEARYEAVTADISQELKELELEEEKP